MRKYYTLSAKNLYALASVLINMRIPFTFDPHKAFLNRKITNDYHKSVIDVELETEYVTLADIMYRMNERYNSTFNLTIEKES